LIDADPQGSARDWNSANDGKILPVIGLDRKTIEADIKNIQGYEYAIIDGAPQLREMAVAAIKAADIVLIPVQPSPLDIWATSDLVELIKERQLIADKPKAAFIVSRQIQDTAVGKEVREVLNQSGLKVFGNGTFQRVAYSDSLASGNTAFEAGGKAKEEIEAITNELWEFINE
jgi:chromosome partitioning protein